MKYYSDQFHIYISDGEVWKRWTIVGSKPDLVFGFVPCRKPHETTVREVTEEEAARAVAQLGRDKDCFWNQAESVERLRYPELYCSYRAVSVVM